MTPSFQDSDTGFLLTNSITITGGNNNSITPLSGFSNISAQTVNADEEEEAESNFNSLIILHNTDSKVMLTELELQSTIS